jgi:hypothetical protein
MPYETPRRGCEDNIKMDYKEIGREVMDWNHLVQDTGQWLVDVNTVMNLWIS